MGAPRHRTHVDVLSDLAEAVGYLRIVAPDQAPRLTALYREARQRVRTNPLAHATLYDDYRRVVLVPFKYMIVYVTDGQSTDVLAVLHARRNPATIKDELTGRTFE